MCYQVSFHGWAPASQAPALIEECSASRRQNWRCVNGGSPTRPYFVHWAMWVARVGLLGQGTGQWPSTSTTRSGVVKCHRCATSSPKEEHVAYLCILTTPCWRTTKSTQAETPDLAPPRISRAPRRWPRPSSTGQRQTAWRRARPKRRVFDALASGQYFETRGYRRRSSMPLEVTPLARQCAPAYRRLHPIHRARAMARTIHAHPPAIP